MAVANFERLFPGTVGFEADATSQGLVVKQDDQGFIVLPDAGKRAYGVIVKWAPKGSVAGLGIGQGYKYPAQAAEAFPLNAELTPDATGRLKVATAGDVIFARADEAAIQAGDIVTVILI